MLFDRAPVNEMNCSNFSDHSLFRFHNPVSVVFGRGSRQEVVEKLTQISY